MKNSIQSRLTNLEHCIVDATTHGGVSRALLDSIVGSLHEDDIGLELRRRIAMLEHTSPKSPDLPALRAECRQNSRSWIGERFGAEAAAALFDRRPEPAP